jgi:hypothetical protein
MGWTQDTIWNNAFSYAYPISFLGAIFYGVLAVAQTDVSNVITNKNWLVAFNIFIGLCGLISISVWFNADASFINGLTQYVDLDVNKVKKSVKTS